MQALFELMLLNATGYGLDLLECAATGTAENLIYISPKSGRAVCAEAGEPYKDKLFHLPAFFLDEAADSTTECVASALHITSFFLDRAAAELHKQPLNISATRKQLQFA
jgi:DNA repair protein RecO (recombination protein O)